MNLLASHQRNFSKNIKLIHPINSNSPTPNPPQHQPNPAGSFSGPLSAAIQANVIKATPKASKYVRNGPSHNQTVMCCRLLLGSTTILFRRRFLFRLTGADGADLARRTGGGAGASSASSSLDTDTVTGGSASNHFPRYTKAAPQLSH
jgi:hypothetical protein